MSVGGDNESGVLVYPPLPVPRPPRKTDPRVSTQLDQRHRGAAGGGFTIAVVVTAAVAGAIGAWFLRPVVAPDPRIATADQRAEAAAAQVDAERARAEASAKLADAAAQGKRDTEAKLAVAATAEAKLAGQTADEVTRRKDAAALEAKLRAASDRAAMAVALEGEDVHIRIATAALFKPNDDAISDRGKAALSRLASVLNDAPDRAIAVQGHTDDTPVPLPAAPKPAPAPVVKGRPAPQPPAAPVVRFPTNWELSGARAVAVVHYLQDVAKLDPSRLSAMAFSQYAPLSKRDKSLNRRIEIVVIARPAAAKK